ncbi:Zn(II)2Cys6 transcription factor [Aspergillus homomorphus CBS 101889]|uniref:C6 transcription factor n=1 Tax=Aspergillus homomorphus (strain CBS 101889) TaxID=1450537 RepID=A0A395HRB8_ASPHC|nr:C6 transcription factor [Aspergillus homomorphus CBS 101889]RAL08804.1 C6 transcription factor [Aspergillus homomorphus CBS 101889]
MNDFPVAPRAGRARTACDVCRHRRIRCDGVKPACETCHYAGVPCVFTPPPAVPRKTVREQLAEHKVQVQHLEEALRAERAKNALTRFPLIDQPSPDPAPAPVGGLVDSYGFDAALSAFMRTLGFCGFGPKPTPFLFPTDQHRMPSIFNLDQFAHQLTFSFKAEFPHHTSRIIHPQQPPPSLIRTVIDYFFNNSLYSVFPVIDPDTLLSLRDSDLLNAFQDPVTPMRSVQVCLVALTALVTRLRDNEPAFAGADSEAFLQSVLARLPELVMSGDDDLWTLRTLILAVIYLAPLGAPQSAELILAMAIRLLINLGGNRTQDIHKSSSLRKHAGHLRALFWLCYSIDREMSIRSLHPPFLHDIDCDIELPEQYLMASSEHQPDLSLSPTAGLLYPTDLRMSIIKSKIYRLLYSDYGLAQSAAIRVQYIRELDEELSNVKARFPADCRPENLSPGSIPDSWVLDLSLRAVNMHLEYYYCLAIIHGACRITGSHPSPDEVSPLSSSIELCNQAARSILLYLSRLRHLIIPQTFWIYAQFILSALVSLGWKLIAEPIHPSAIGDLHLIEHTREMFTGLKEMNNPSKFPAFYVMEAFILRLVSLVVQSNHLPSG